MKRLVSALAAVALIASPISAVAQSHGGGFHGGGFHGAGSFHGAGAFRGGGFRGRFFPFFGFGLGFALAAAPWYYGFPGWWWWDYPPYPYYYYGPYGYYGPPPPDGPPVAPPAPGAAAPPAACGSWVWHADQGKYQWVPAPCAPAAPPAGS